jgi:hypothetical protein
VIRSLIRLAGAPSVGHRFSRYPAVPATDVSGLAGDLSADSGDPYGPDLCGHAQQEPADRGLRLQFAATSAQKLLDAVAAAAAAGPVMAVRAVTDLIADERGTGREGETSRLASCRRREPSG